MIPKKEKKVTVRFDQGTLLVDGPEEYISNIWRYLKNDPRTGSFRAQAYHYAPIILELHYSKIPFSDMAKGFSPLELSLKNPLEPLPHQSDALKQWTDAQGRGTVVMPTGAGKTYFAVMAINAVKRPALIIVPTIDLMMQWASVLEKFFGIKCGMLGGGSKEILDITVSTYDSAVLNMEFIGNRFGIVVFDECHHLPGPVNRLAGSMCLAPYRLALTATPEREDEGEKLIHELVGPIVYEAHIDQLEGHVLAPYRTVRLMLELEENERKEYESNRRIYTEFLRANGIYFTSKNDWNRFLALCARNPGGRRVFEAFMKQKRIARGGRSKFLKVWELINKHKDERILIFTAENDMAYELGGRFFLPVITHRTKAAERKEMLDCFRSGEYPVLLTSKVLNEGVDVPEASIGIVVSGSASIREHVQRLGRILRAVNGKEAILYELISEGTSEVSVSRRRTEHRAYKNNWSKRFYRKK
ncbi:MAG: hypothetical protein A2020_07160 [Lentisphaerae bacterium GWF2_45_14]|nr:MAG: hypothetical protein A2020_07160 [Lentisphaerae bacterium GWF2_45_14]